jgi:hypothetical protein
MGRAARAGEEAETAGQISRQQVLSRLLKKSKASQER